MKVEYGICKACMGTGKVKAGQIAINSSQKTIKAPYTQVACKKCLGMGNILKIERG